MVRDEQDQVIGTGAGDEGAERLVGLAEDVGGLAADPGVLVRRVVRVVGRDVVRQRVLRPVDRDPDARHQIPLGVVHQVFGDLDPLRRDLVGLVEVGVGLVPVGGPAHPVDRPFQASLHQVGGQVVGNGERAVLRQDPAGDQRPVDLRRREGERHVQHQHALVRGREVVQERARLDRLVGDRVLLVRARDGLEDVVDAVIDRIDAGQEARPRGPAVGRDRGAEDVALPSVEERLEVGERALLEQGVEDAPIGAVPRDQDHS
jgi:hypothetical protein